MLVKILNLCDCHALVVNLFGYVTFRSGAALLTSLLASLFIGHPFIKWIKSKQGKGQPIRDDGPKSHIKNKKGTPTMGGIIILASLTLSVLLWAKLNNPYIWIILLVTLSLGLLGFIDDYLKISRQTTKGVSGKIKLIYQIIVGIIASTAITFYLPENIHLSLTFPFFKSILLNLGGFFILFSTTVIIASSNAVNLTDGLDGLAIGCVVISSLFFLITSYITGHHEFAQYLQLNHVPGSSELTVFCSALIGSGLGFLWFNAPPANIFMGDVGSLSIGGALGTLSIITKSEIIWLFVGGVFVMEALSVILQVGYFKLTGGKRIFLMAPLHHHFEKKGWAETTVVVRFWIFSIVFMLIGLATFKIR